MKLVTRESVATAAQALVDSGQRASVRAVQNHLGGGSPNSILPLLNEWKLSRPTVEAPEISIDPRISALIREQVAMASGEAARSAAERATELQADMEVVSKAGREAEAQVEALQAQLDALLDEQGQLKGQLTERARELEVVRQESADQVRGAREQAAATVAAAEGKAREERERADKLVGELSQARARLEQLPTLQSRISEQDQLMQQLRGEMDALRNQISGTAAELATAKAEARAAQALAEERTRAGETLATQLRAELKAAQSREAEAATRLDRMLAELARAQAPVAAPGKSKVS